MQHYAIVEIVGVALQPEEIKINDTLFLRKTKKEDLEVEYKQDIHKLYNPSAILTITDFSTGTFKLQHAVEQIIIILQLFKVGSVFYLKYKTYSEFYFTGLGTHSKINSSNPHKWSYIKSNETDKLKTFFKLMSEKLPESFLALGNNNIDSKTISYQRYCDALIKPDIIEQRILQRLINEVKQKPSRETSRKLED